MHALKSLIDTDGIQVEITIRLGRTRRTISELAALKPEDVLILDQPIADGVELCVGDKVIAHGELTIDESGEDRLCVRILGTAGLT